MKKKRYAICGLSCRGIYHFLLPLFGKNYNEGPNFDNQSEVVGILDIDRARVDAFLLKIGMSVPYYPADKVDLMIQETGADTLIVAGPDSTHCGYIVAGLNAGCDVIVEKPMVIDSGQVGRVQEAERKSGRLVQVAHNYRYTPTHKHLKRMILDGELGRIINVEFTYNLDSRHGSSYFYRWNRLRDLSGGLNIHKCCHHFDLINWWLGDVPETVFAFGGLNYYGANGALRPRDERSEPFSPEEEKKRCPIFQKHHAPKADPASNWISPGWDRYDLSYDVQYPLDQPRYIYDDAIDIEDTYSAVVRYSKGTTMAYSCNFCTPWEGYVLALNGTKGRVEIVHRSDPDPTGKTNPAAQTGLITFYPLFGGKQLIEIPAVGGGHGGADFAIQSDLFGSLSAESRDLELIAGSQAGGYAIALGEAVWHSIASGQPVNIKKLMAGHEPVVMA